MFLRRSPIFSKTPLHRGSSFFFVVFFKGITRCIFVFVSSCIRELAVFVCA